MRDGVVLLMSSGLEDNDFEVLLESMLFWVHSVTKYVMGVLQLIIAAYV